MEEDGTLLVEHQETKNTRLSRNHDLVTQNDLKIKNFLISVPTCQQDAAKTQQIAQSCIFQNGL